jgi:Tol biopolymer transport system component
VVGEVLDERVHPDSYAGDQSGDQAYADGEGPDVLHVMRQGAADQRSGDIAHGADYRAPKLAAREAWTPRGGIIERWTHAARIGEYLTKADYNAECDRESQSQDPVQTGAESEAADGAEQRLPRQGIMLQPARRSVEFDRDGNAGGDARSEAEEETKSQAVADSENDRVGHRAGEQPQRAVLPAQQIVCKVKAAEHIQAGAGNADGREGMVVHGVSIVDAVASGADRKRMKKVLLGIAGHELIERNCNRDVPVALMVETLQSFDILRAMSNDLRNSQREFSAPNTFGWMKMQSHKLLLVVAAMLLCSTLAWSQTFTLEQVMSSPFPSQLTAAKAGSRVAWVFDAQGVRNVWVADGPDFVKSGRQVTHYTTDDGQPIASLRLTPDGQTVVYALGSELNGGGDSADPDHSVQQPKQQVWAKDVDSAEPPRLLGELGCPDEECEDIEISPDGKSAAWSAKKKIWLASVDGKQQAKELAYIRGDAGEPKWSPDSKSIAMVVDRGDHKLIGVYDVGGQSLRYLAPSVDKDDLPRWSPDGKWIAYVKTAGTEQKVPLIPVRPKPWAIWIADATTGQGHQVWHSGGTLRDSLPQETEDVSFSFAGDRIVFGSEQDGRNHLYSDRRGGVAARRRAAALLTPGEFDVEDVALAPDRKSVIYSSNEADVDRRHIWRVSVEGGQATAPGQPRRDHRMVSGSHERRQQRGMPGINRDFARYALHSHRDGPRNVCRASVTPKISLARSWSRRSK